MALDQAIFTSAFKKNLCVAAYAGAIQFGEVQNKDQLFFKTIESVCVPQKKLPEFFTVLEALGKNLTLKGRSENNENTENTNTSFELCSKEVLVLDKCKIQTHRNCDLSKPSFILEFDEFMYLDFLSSIAHVLLFVTMPTKDQFLAMKKYSDVETESTQKKVEIAIDKMSPTSPHKKFMLEQFLCMNTAIIEIFSKILRIIGEK